MPRLIDKLDLSNKRIVYAVGDIHGRFDELTALLERIRFDKEKDFLISVGDLVDRGPTNEKCINFIGQPWFKHILGNHEEMAYQHLRGESYIHTINGGGWLSKLDLVEQEHIVGKLMDAPYLLEVKTPKGLTCGFVHADLRFGTWQANIESQDFNTFTWSRMTVKELRNPSFDPSIKGIDKVFFGHNAMYNPVIRGNCYWIDTGSGFDDGGLTIVNVDTDTFYREKS